MVLNQLEERAKGSATGAALVPLQPRRLAAAVGGVRRVQVTSQMPVALERFVAALTDVDGLGGVMVSQVSQAGVPAVETLRAVGAFDR